MTDDTMTISLHVNGAALTLTAAPDARLIDLLRDDAALVAAKKACGIGRCGACTVLCDGEPVPACLVMAYQLEVRAIVTPEGLGDIREANILRAALAAENAFQCGYCAPGIVTVLTALLIRNPGAGEAEIRSGLEGNLCRCTGYHSILRGALAAAATLQGVRAGEDA